MKPEKLKWLMNLQDPKVRQEAIEWARVNDVQFAQCEMLTVGFSTPIARAEAMCVYLICLKLELEECLHDRVSREQLMVKFPGVSKDSEDRLIDGEPVYFHAGDVLSVEGKEHRWHSFRPGQSYTVVNLRDSGLVKVNLPAGQVQEIITKSLRPTAMEGTER